MTVRDLCLLSAYPAAYDNHIKDSYMNRLDFLMNKVYSDFSKKHYEDFFKRLEPIKKGTLQYNHFLCVFNLLVFRDILYCYNMNILQSSPHSLTTEPKWNNSDTPSTIYNHIFREGSNVTLGHVIEYKPIAIGMLLRSLAMDVEVTESDYYDLINGNSTYLDGQLNSVEYNFQEICNDLGLKIDVEKVINMFNTIFPTTEY